MFPNNSNKFIQTTFEIFADQLILEKWLDRQIIDLFKISQPDHKSNLKIKKNGITSILITTSDNFKTLKQFKKDPSYIISILTGPTSIDDQHILNNPDVVNFFEVDHNSKTIMVIKQLLELIVEKEIENKLIKIVNDSKNKYQSILTISNRQYYKFLQDMKTTNGAISIEISKFLTGFLTFFETTKKLSSDIDFFSKHEETKSKFISLLENSIKKYKLINQIFFCKRNIDLIYISKKPLIIIPLTETNQSNEEFICLDLNKKHSNEELMAIQISWIARMTSNFFKQNIRTDQLNNLEPWEESFSKIPFPIALISNEGELILHNSHFLKLKILPKKCLETKNNTQIETGDTIYKLYRSNLTHHHVEYHYFLFATDFQTNISNTKNISSSELGIIASSIAHELNNPVAGILAAISLLQIENEFRDESKSQIEEMNESALKCKQLIDMFLGLSKTTPNHTKKHGPFSKALQQAVSLLRFRMIESNIKLDIISKENKQTQLANINTPIISMIFYLILNEVLTAYSHFKLISMDDNTTIPQQACNMTGTISENSNMIQIKFKEKINFASKIKKSKLIQHLVNMENLELSLSSDKIIIKTKKP